MRLCDILAETWRYGISLDSLILILVIVAIVNVLVITHVSEHYYRKGFDDGRREWYCWGLRNANKRIMK